MKNSIAMLLLIASSLTYAIEPNVTVPWHEFDDLYKKQITQSLKAGDAPEPDPIITLEQVQYNLKIVDAQATGSVSIIGNVLLGEPEPLRLFGQSIAVTNVLEAQNATLLANNGYYQLYTYEPGVFSIKFTVSIPITDFQVKPKLLFDVPPAVRNELKIEFSENLKLLDSNSLHKIDGSYFFPPTRLLSIGFEHVNQVIDGLVSEDTLLSEVDTPNAVLDSVTFFASFAEDGAVLSAMHLVLPANEKNQLELNPIEGAEVWSLQVNDKPRALYESAAGMWVIPLDAKVESKVVLAYLTRGQKLGLEGRLDFSIPQTGLTARSVNLTVGLPERMHMLAMDSDLQPANGRDWPVFNSFSGRPHYFSKPFYRGQEFSASIIYQEPVNP
jgi:hypothetical protein